MALRRRWCVGPEREDAGRAKAAYFVGSCMTKVETSPTALLPNPPEQDEAADNLAAMEQISRALEAQWQPP